MHNSTFFNFRLSEWPRAQTGAQSLFKKYYNDWPVGDLINYMIEQFSKTDRLFVMRSTFTLVNVFSPISQQSFGYLTPPNKSLTPLVNPLTFTFAVSRFPYTDKKPPKFKHLLGDYTVLWGEDVYSPTSYFTVSAPSQVFSPKPTYSPRDMYYLYMTIGMWSKGFVNRNLFCDAKLNYQNVDYPADLAKAKFYSKPLLGCASTVPYNDWVYNDEFWKRAANVFSPQSLNRPSFVEYYARYLVKHFGRAGKSPVITDFEDSLVSKLTDDLRMFFSSTGYTLEKSSVLQWLKTPLPDRKDFERNPTTHAINMLSR